MENNLVFSEDGRTLMGTRCKDIESAIIPEGVTSIGDDAFEDCLSLNSVSLPESLTDMGEQAFMNCIDLTSITIPRKVENIGEWAFYGCRNLSHINVEEGNPFFDSRENCNAIIETYSNTLILGG